MRILVSGSYTEPRLAVSGMLQSHAGFWKSCCSLLTNQKTPMLARHIFFCPSCISFLGLAEETEVFEQPEVALQPALPPAVPVSRAEDLFVRAKVKGLRRIVATR